jgi:hypothetical protein
MSSFVHALAPSLGKLGDRRQIRLVTVLYAVNPIILRNIHTVAANAKAKDKLSLTATNAK